MSFRRSSTVGLLATGTILVGLLWTACDEVRSFTVVNKTKLQLTIELAIEEPAAERPHNLEPFILAPEESDSESGGIFYRGSKLHVRALAGSDVILDTVYTYNELKTKDFHIEILPADRP